MINNRNLKLDNIKGILIYLVVLGHLLFSYKYFNNNSSMIIVRFIYSFHMPLFFIVSGIFSKRINNKRLFNLFVLFLAVNFSYIIYDYINTNNFSVFTLKYSSWYLLFLALYRLIISSNRLIYYINKYSKYLIFILFLLVIFISFIPLPLVVRFFYFFYFFIFGYYFDLQRVKLFSRFSLIWFLVIISSIICIAFIPFNLNFFMGFNYNNSIEFLFRVFLMIIIPFLFFSLYNLIWDKKVKFLTVFGKYSLMIYLFHRIITLVLNDLFIDCRYMLLIMLFFAFIICVLFGNIIVNVWVNNLLDKLYLMFKNNRKLFNIVVFVIIIIVLVFSFRNDINNYFKSVLPVSYEEQSKIDNSFSIGFVGDLILLENQVANSKSDSGYDFDYMFENTSKYFKSVDYMIGVLEGPVDDDNDYSFGNFDDNKELRLNYPSEFLNSIKSSGIDLVTIANNHLLDRGVSSVKRTINNLKYKSLDFVGGYINNLDNKRKIVDVDGIKIGILAYTYGINYYEEDDLLDNYGYLTNYLCSSNSKNFKKIKNSVVADFDYLKSKKVDLIIVLPHYGTQFSNEVDDYQRIWNKIFLNNGADIILGDHSHRVQPILWNNNSLIVNSPGNYVNSYIKHDGDISMMVKIYVDRNKKNILATSIIPLLVINDGTKYTAVSVYDGLKKRKFSSYIDRLNYANYKVTDVSMNYKISNYNLEEEYFYFKDGYRKNNKYKFSLTDNDKKSTMYNLIDNSNSICFIGDSITEGTLNNYYPWYQPLVSLFSNKKVINFSKGGYTTFDIINDYSSQLKNSSCELVIINIGTNDIRYNLTSSSIYYKNIKKIVSFLDNKDIILMAPWRTTDSDKKLYVNRREKKNLYVEYDGKLKKMAASSDRIYFIDGNKYIKEAIEYMGEDTYLLDGVHPNNTVGIQLYSYATMR